MKFMSDLNKLLSTLPHDQLQEIYSMRMAEVSFYEFFKQGWPHLERKGVKYKDNWHIKALCDHLQACYERKILNLLLNLSPRCGKSTIFIAFFAWVWAIDPSQQFIFGSHSFTLGTKESRKCRNFIMSAWYQSRWGNRFHLVKDTEDLLINNHQGFRMVASPKSQITGQGADFLFLDDANDAQEAKSDTKRNHTNEWFKTAFSGRLNVSPDDEHQDTSGVIDTARPSVRIVQQQRVHLYDVAGFIMAYDISGQWVKFIIPMRYAKERHCTTVDIDDSGKPWTDPRTEEGQLMWPSKFTKKYLDIREEEIGASDFASQYQQLPAPAEGGIIKKGWFQWHKEEHLPKIEYVLQSWDTAFSEKKSAAYSACTTWGVFYDNKGVGNVILLSTWRGRVGYPELREMAKRLYHDYRDNSKIHNPNLKGRNVDRLLIESKATGDPLIRDLRDAGILATPYNPTRQGDKFERVHKITQYLEAGLVWLPAQAPTFTRLTKEADDFLQEISYFPNTESRDLVDTMTQALRRLSDERILMHPRDPKEIPSYYDQVSVY